MVLGHVGVALAVQTAQTCLLRLVELERDAERAGHDLLGQVVARRAEAAGRNDEVGAGAGKLHRLLKPRAVIADNGLPIDIDAQLREQARDSRRVGIDGVAEEQFRCRRQ